ncbi:MAG: helicase-related protein, partial [Oscillospiraceae bacterium]
AFKNGEYDIMIGTQMVSKGLNFPKVTLVGILNADLSLFSEDFRSFEKTFSLITQTIGRAGRGEKAGRAIIETLSPDIAVLDYCKTGDYEGFYEEEIKFRKNGLYPPFCNLVCVKFKNTDEQGAIDDSGKFLRFLAKTAETRFGELPIRILGAAPSLPYKKASSYYMQILIKCRADKNFLELLNAACENYYKEKNLSSLIIDMFYN